MDHGGQQHVQHKPRVGASEHCKVHMVPFQKARGWTHKNKNIIKRATIILRLNVGHLSTGPPKLHPVPGPFHKAQRTPIAKITHSMAHPMPNIGISSASANICQTDPSNICQTDPSIPFIVCIWKMFSWVVPFWGPFLIDDWHTLSLWKLGLSFLRVPSLCLKHVFYYM